MSWKKEEIEKLVSESWKMTNDFVRHYNTHSDVRHQVCGTAPQLTFKVGEEEVALYDATCLEDIKVALDEWMLRLQECTLNIQTDEGSWDIGNGADILKELERVKNPKFTSEFSPLHFYQEVEKVWTLLPPPPPPLEVGSTIDFDDPTVAESFMSDCLKEK